MQRKLLSYKALNQTKLKFTRLFLFKGLGPGSGCVTMVASYTWANVIKKFKNSTPTLCWNKELLQIMWLVLTKVFYFIAAKLHYCEKAKLQFVLSHHKRPLLLRFPTWGSHFNCDIQFTVVIVLDQEQDRVLQLQAEARQWSAQPNSWVHQRAEWSHWRHHDTGFNGIT